MHLLRLWIALAALALPLRAGESALTGGMVAEPFALRFSPSNSTSGNITLAVKAGSVWKTADADRFVALRAVENALPPGATASLSVPAAALSSKSSWKAGAPVSPSPDVAEPRLEPLL